MGYTDPVGDTIDDQWDSFALNEAKTYNSNPQSVCFQYVTECDTYKKMYDGISENAQSGCRRAVSTEFSVASRDEYFHNAFSSNASEVGATKKNHCYYPVATECAGTDKASCKVKSAANLIVGETQCKWTTKCVPVEKWTAECKVTQQACNKCDSACKDYITREARAGAEAASLFTMCTVCFTLAAVVWNNFITRGDNDEFTGLFSTLAYVINGGVLLVGFVMAVLCAVRMIQSDAYFGLLLCLLFLGVFLLISGGLAVFGIKNGNAGLINIASVCLAIFGYIMLIIGITLMVVSGTVMDDANANYDANYAAMRQSVEAVEPSFCQIPTLDCEKITVFGTNSVVINLGNLKTHNSAKLWQAQYLAMTAESEWITRTYPAKSGLAVNCAGDEVCAACSLLLASKTQRESWHPKLVSSSANSGKGSDKQPANYWDGVNLATVMTNLDLYEGKTKTSASAFVCSNHLAATNVTIASNTVTYGYVSSCADQDKGEKGGTNKEVGGVAKCAPSGDRDTKGSSACRQACVLGWKFKKGTSGLKIPTCPIGCKIGVDTCYTNCAGKNEAACTGSVGIKSNKASKDDSTGGDMKLRGCYTSKAVLAAKLKPEDQTTKDALKSYMVNVTTQWYNRTIASSKGIDYDAKSKGKQARGMVSRMTGKCEAALQSWGKSKGCGEKYDANTNNKKYFTAGRSERFPPEAGCYDCNGAGGTAGTTFKLTQGGDLIATEFQRAACLRAMYTVINAKACNALLSEANCRKQFQAASDESAKTCATAAKAATKASCKNFEAFRTKMPSTFCQFTDESCQAKLKQKTEDDLGTVAVVGVIFCIFFLFILYATSRGVVTYMLDGGDDE